MSKVSLYIAATYVLTERLFPTQPGTDVKFYSGSIAALVAKIRKENMKDVWIVG